MQLEDNPSILQEIQGSRADLFVIAGVEVVVGVAVGRTQVLMALHEASVVPRYWYSVPREKRWNVLLSSIQTQEMFKRYYPFDLHLVLYPRLGRQKSHTAIL